MHEHGALSPHNSLVSCLATRTSRSTTTIHGFDRGAWWSRPAAGQPSSLPPLRSVQLAPVGRAFGAGCDRLLLPAPVAPHEAAEWSAAFEGRLPWGNSFSFSAAVPVTACIGFLATVPTPSGPRSGRPGRTRMVSASASSAMPCRFRAGWSFGRSRSEPRRGGRSGSRRPRCDPHLGRFGSASKPQELVHRCPVTRPWLSLAGFPFAECPAKHADALRCFSDRKAELTPPRPQPRLKCIASLTLQFRLHHRKADGNARYQKGNAIPASLRYAGEEQDGRMAPLRSSTAKRGRGTAAAKQAWWRGRRAALPQPMQSAAPIRETVPSALSMRPERRRT
jgi:hypothetical protein